MWTHRFALLTAALTWLLLLVGGIVHGTGSSLACPDWPLCFGQFFPTMEGNVLVEHGHRLFASAVGLCTIALCISALRDGKRAHARVPALAIFALLLVIFQGVLGGLTVIYRLPTLISWAHLCTSMLFFATVITVAVLTRHVASGGLRFHRDDVPRGVYALLLVTTVLCYVQLALGGLVRHTGGGLACLDIPLCRGSLLPLGEHPTVIIHAVHRLNGLLFALSLFITAPRLRHFLRRETDAPRRALLLALPLLMLVQIGLGILSVWSYLGLFYVTAHLGVGALLWGGLVVLCLSLRSVRSEVTADGGALVHASGQGGAV
jgi:heme A synthase